MEIKEPDGCETSSHQSVPPDEGLTPSQECHACGESTERNRLHYGGITCDSCRTFFRRATIKKKKDMCKKDGRCEVMTILLIL